MLFFLVSQRNFCLQVLQKLGVDKDRKKSPLYRNFKVPARAPSQFQLWYYSRLFTVPKNRAETQGESCLWTWRLLRWLEFFKTKLSRPSYIVWLFTFFVFVCFFIFILFYIYLLIYFWLIKDLYFGNFLFLMCIRLWVASLLYFFFCNFFLIDWYLRQISKTCALTSRGK